MARKTIMEGLPIGTHFGSYFKVTHDKDGNRKPEYKKDQRRRKG